MLFDQISFIGALIFPDSELKIATTSKRIYRNLITKYIDYLIKNSITYLENKRLLEHTDERQMHQDEEDVN